LLSVVIHAADVQDRDGARLVLDRRTRRLFPFIERIFADAGYQGPVRCWRIRRPPQCTFSPSAGAFTCSRSIAFRIRRASDEKAPAGGEKVQ
jgi:hypothetical protein